MAAEEIISFIRGFRLGNPAPGKVEIASACVERFGLRRSRSLYIGKDVALRFVAVTNPRGANNTLLSLSALAKVDHVPFVICVVQPDAVDFALANSTLLRRVSHSSQALRLGNIRGSFNSGDLLRDYDGISNEPANFDLLFAIHGEHTWEDNVERLVEATNAIVAVGSRYQPTAEELANIQKAPALAREISCSEDYRILRNTLESEIESKAERILSLALVDNVNVRGNHIEQLITGGANTRSVGDMRHVMVGGTGLEIEIKTKLLSRASAPKAYSIDKLLRLYGTGDAAMAYCFVGIDQHAKRLTVRTVSVLDALILDVTRVQMHWAGRNSRGVTQLREGLEGVFSTDFTEVIDVEKARRFIGALLAL